MEPNLSPEKKITIPMLTTLARSLELGLKALALVEAAKAGFNLTDRHHKRAAVLAFKAIFLYQAGDVVKFFPEIHKELNG